MEDGGKQNRWIPSKERISFGAFEFENKDDGGGVDVFRQEVGGSDLRGRWWQKETKRVTNDPANESSGNAVGWISRVEGNVHLD